VICEVCTVLEAEPDDCLCVTCRVEVTAATSVIHDPVENLLSGHQRLLVPQFTMCLCGVVFEGPAFYRRHVAELIYAELGLPGPVPWTPASDRIEG
jgi:hypothetical protein